MVGVLPFLLSALIAVIARKLRGRRGWEWGFGSLAIMLLGKAAKLAYSGGDGLEWVIFCFCVAGLLLFSLKPIKKSELAERACPYCAERIKRGAVVCRYCRKDLEPSDKSVIQRFL